jgi:N-acetyl sugar amidotransferase
VKWCRSCILPDTRPNLVIGKDGICNACAAHGTKRQIDWLSRANAFAQVVETAKKRSIGYDCLIPVSGGKDSTWQVVTCLEAGLRPLAVTWKTPGRTPIGEANLTNLVALGVDHIDYQINPRVEKRFMKAALIRFGDPAIPMHMALFAIPLAIAVRFRIPLVVWGENSAFEYGGTAEERTGFALDAKWLKTYGVTHGTTWGDWLKDGLGEKDLLAYAGPSEAELASAGVNAVFLGYYFPWDPESSLAVAQAHGFRPRREGPKTGYYDYADIDDDFISVHHWFKWYKFGFTRLFDNLSLEIRNGRMSRSEALDIVRRRGDDTPHDDILKLCRFIGMSVEDFFLKAEAFRNQAIWKQRGGVWTMPEFLIEDWIWT